MLILQVALQRQQSIGNIEEENLGSVNFSLLYDSEQGLITVRLIQARDLVARDFSGTADPYCRLCLLPTKRTQIQSKVHKKTLNPEFHEEFIFDASSNEIGRMSLQILIYDFDQFSRDECIGEVVVPLGSLDLTERVTLWKGISPYNKKKKEVSDKWTMRSLPVSEWVELECADTEYDKPNEALW